MMTMMMVNMKVMNDDDDNPFNFSFLTRFFQTHLKQPSFRFSVKQPEGPRAGCKYNRSPPPLRSFTNYGFYVELGPCHTSFFGLNI